MNLREKIDNWLLIAGFFLLLFGILNEFAAKHLQSEIITGVGIIIAALGWIVRLRKRPSARHQLLRENKRTATGHDLKLARKPWISEHRLLGRKDTLTGLGDQDALAQTMNQAIVAADQTEQKIILIAFDLDRLKDINGCFGFETGNAILRATAKRLEAVGADLVVRLSGDRFAALFARTGNSDTADMIGATCLDRIGQPIRTADHGTVEISPSASAGIAVYPDHGKTFADLFQRAELAVDTSKRLGGRRCSVFQINMIDKLKRRQALEHDLKRAIENNHLHLVFQPQVDLKTGLIFGAEALMRWHDPERGPIPPTVFIPVAESTGLIRPLGSWLIEEACRCAKVWRQQGLDLLLAINISTAQLRQHDLIQSIAETLSQHRLEPGDIELELTESLFVDPAELMMRRTLDDLARMGVNLAIDDFGTGFSSLSYLKHLPVSKIKIDKSFITGISEERIDEALIRTIIGLGKTFDKTVLAEGVENEAQWRFLREEGCHQAQGYFFARPLSFEACSAMALRQQSGLRTHEGLHWQTKRRAG